MKSDERAILRHQLYQSRIYRIWANIKARCFNQNHRDYKQYGARGITMCDEWKHDFLIFYDWAIANGYTDSLTIDRINNDGNYEPDNCRWATRKEQCNNYRKNHLLEYNGEVHSIAEWSEITGINYFTLRDRINRSKWSIEKALTTR